MRRIGIFGGTFNPVHIGHLMIAQMALDELRLNKVIFVPCYWPPHKVKRGVLNASHRLAMVRIAVADHKQFEVSDVEVKKTGKSYTIDTLKYFRNIHPKQTRIYFIIGGDMVSGLKNWKKSLEIKNIAEFIVVNRPGSIWAKETQHRLHMIHGPGIDISSSFLRQRIKSGQSIRYFVPDKVLRYINKHRLFK